MLTTWNQSPRNRPTFADLKATFDSLLLADRKGDYIEFSFDPNKDIDQFETSLELPAVNARSISPIPRRHSHVTDSEECKLLLPSDTPSGGDCKVSSSGSLNLSPRKLSPRRRSPQKQSSRQNSPASRFSPSCSSPKKEKSRHGSPALLFPGQRSPGSLSPQSCSPLHGLVTPGESGSGAGERLRPMSLFVARDRAGDVAGGEDRYVREPTKLANLSQAVNHGSTGLVVGNGESQQLRLRRGSEGTLNMNSDGYVSFVGVAYSRDRRVNPSTSTEIQITVTQDL